MQPDDPIGSLEKERRKLYTPGAEQADIKRDLSRPKSRLLPHAWRSSGASKSTGKAQPHKHVRTALLFFWMALGFFVIALSIGAYILFSGDRSVSTANVAVSIQGPTTIAGGDTTSFLITVTNNNPVPIQQASLALTFPPGTRSASNVLASLPYDTESLGTIAPGARVERTVKAVLFGGQGSVLSIPAELKFRTAGSNAVFVKDTTYRLSVVATPLSVSISAPSQTVPGQPIELTATIRSNATTPITGVALQANYPNGFAPTKTSVTPVGDVFPIGVLAPGATKTVTIDGTLVGQDGEQRVFRFTVGTSDAASANTVSVAYMTQEAPVTITQPFLATSVSVNGSTAGQTVIAPGTPTTVSLSWQNTLDVPITNAHIVVAMSGTAVSAQGVRVSDGQYQSASQSVVFSRDTDSSLGSLAPGASGRGSFTFTPQALSTASSTPGTSPVMTLSVSISGQRAGQGNVPQTVSSSVTKTLKVTTSVGLQTYALYSTGPFANSGPVPPVANKTTTYTVVWQVTNTTNDVAGGTITANLPTDIRFVGPTSPADGSLSYDNGAHTVTWDVGDLPAGASRTGAFQVALTPSTSQRNAEPPLTGTATFSGFDRFAQVNVSAEASAVTTDLSHDPMYQTTGAGTVQ